ncbi:uncharacterized protein [Vicugna pacos]|uniref:Uncharacterized protein isoform X4 n=1 Tax=Vicugna pacos TaxID=30538 RepID=A0ABM5DI40_VICPA
MLPQPAPTAPVNALVVVRELYVQKRVQCVSQKIPKPCSSVRDCVFACVPLSPLSVHPLTPAPSWDSPQVLIFCTDAPRGLSGPGEYLSAGCFDALCK